jgi:hypothetical protein
MPFAICRLSIIPVRREPDFFSEMTTQVRGGEGVEILEDAGHWWRVRLLADDYEGWVTGRQFTLPEESPPAPPAVFTDDLCGEAVRDDYRIALPMGTPLADFHDGKFTLGGDRWTWRGNVRCIPEPPPDGIHLFAYARRFLFAPYQWGGRSVFGIDCSGFVQSVFRAFGVPLRRDSKMQVEQGTAVPDRAAAVPGDLAFFGTPELGVGHVGLLLPCSEIIHASTFVRIDDMTDDGIRNRETGEISHRTVAFRRVL